VFFFFFFYSAFCELSVCRSFLARSKKKRKEVRECGKRWRSVSRRKLWLALNNKSCCVVTFPFFFPTENLGAVERWKSKNDERRKL